MNFKRLKTSFKVRLINYDTQVAEVLTQANCGGCGYPGCSGFADACVKAGSLDGKFCPVGGQPVMTQIAEILGLDATAAEPMVAVVRCNGTCALSLIHIFRLPVLERRCLSYLSFVPSAG